MKSDTLINSHHQWTAWQKIAFRFFLPFLTLQVIAAEGFWANWFGLPFGFLWRIFEWSEKIFVQPCLWLNDHIFHFKYAPSWTAFSGSLQIIREIAYLFLSGLICVLWTIPDKKRIHYNRLLYWFSECLVIALSCVVFGYGISKIVPIQMRIPSFIDLQTPVGDLSPFELIWTTFGYGKPYQVLGGFLEVLGAILILFKRTRVAGLLIIASVMLNVVFLNYTYQIGVLVLSFYVLLITLFLLAPYTRQLSRFFFTGQPAILPNNAYVPAWNFKTKLFKVVAILFVSVSFIANSLYTYSRYVRAVNTNHSRQHSLIKNYVANSDTLKFIENDTICWRIWSERVTDGKRFVTIATMKRGANKTYTIERDTSKHTLTLHPFNRNDTTSLHFSYTDIDTINWHLDGTIQQKNIHVELQKINPDTTMNLLKTKRMIIPLDDESNNQ